MGLVLYIKVQNFMFVCFKVTQTPLNGSDFLKPNLNNGKDSFSFKKNNKEYFSLKKQQASGQCHKMEHQR